MGAPMALDVLEAETASPSVARMLGGERAVARAELLAADVRWPRPSLLEQPLELAGKAAEAAASLGLLSVGALLEHLPRARREARTIAGLAVGESATVIAEVHAIAQRPVRRRGMRPLVEATVVDETGPMKATFFNQPWLVQSYPPGTRVVLHGRYGARNRFNVSYHARAAASDGGAMEGDEVSHYPATDGLSSTQILALMASSRWAIEHVVEPLPALMRAAEGMADRGAALAAMHFGDRPSDSEVGRRRLAFEELLLTQLGLLWRRARRDAASAAVELDAPFELTARWCPAGLPFELTGDQRTAIAELDADLRRSRPMQRLLMGEVGSGKTIVALWAMLRSVEHGHQALLMAPTETLAEQHFATLQRLLSSIEPVPMALLTGSTPAARRAGVLAKLQSGELALVVGTHALIEPDVRFRSLAVAVVDEQHRFGVRQRSALDTKGPDGLVPHTLHMTATPIPRTLALCAYGDLDQTRLRELPAGRRPIATHVAAGERERARAYERIRSELRAGRQAYVVCALLAESDEAQARAAEVEYERLAAGELRDFRLVLLHGQMRNRERQAAMAAFVAGEAQVLVATSVVEVGIDVANATVMLIENAERFGISQLHQLRGRVGRGEHESLCLLFGPKESPRLRALAEHADGFALAEIDLELRKEGELIGVRQSGFSQFQIAQLPEDAPLLDRAREHAQAIVAADPELRLPQHELLADALVAAHGEEGARPIPA